MCLQFASPECWYNGHSQILPLQFPLLNKGAIISVNSIQYKQLKLLGARLKVKGDCV